MSAQQHSFLTSIAKNGVVVALVGMLLFALNDVMGKWLVATYSVGQVVMLRSVPALIVLAPFVWWMGWRPLVQVEKPKMQVARAVLSTMETMAFYAAVFYLPLADVMTYWLAAPIYIAALSPLLLGEHVGWRRWTAIGIGFLGVLVILQPGVRVFAPAALIPLASAFMFALYGLLTRFVSRTDSSSVSFFWTGITGAVVMTAIGVFHWQPMTGADWAWMAVLCCTAATAHWLMIRALEVAEASAVQPFNYLMLPFAAAIGITVFGDRLEASVAVGAVIVVAAGLFTLWRARKTGRG